MLAFRDWRLKFFFQALKMVEHVLTLQTDLFEVSTPCPNFINARCFGEDFALWLSQRLMDRGFTPEAPIQEDWGWVVIVRHQGYRFTLSIGITEESIGQIPAEWLVSVSYEKPLNGFRAWIRSAPAFELSELAGTLEATLRSEPRIQRVSQA